MVGAMTVVLNGEQREIREGMTVAELVTELGLGTRRIAVEVNRAIIPRDEYATCRLRAGDHVEIVHFVGGG
jgi:thiamine biosynthesis protein ThiS